MEISETKAAAWLRNRHKENRKESTNVLLFHLRWQRIRRLNYRVNYRTGNVLTVRLRDHRQHRTICYLCFELVKDTRSNAELSRFLAATNICYVYSKSNEDASTSSLT